MPKGIPLTEAELNRKRHEIITACLPLFVEKGFHETSMQQVAAAAGLGKSTLYDYFQTKDEILVFLVEEEVAGFTQRTNQILQQPVGVVKKLRQIMLMHLEYMTQNKAFYIKLTLEIMRLGQESQARIQVKRHAYQDIFRSLIEQGIRDGAFRPVDPMLAARLLYTALTPIVFTTRPTGTPQEMMEEAFEMLMRGIQAG